MPDRLRGYVALTLAVILVGSSFVVAKDLTEDLPVFLANTIRFLIAALVLLPLMFRRHDELRSLSRSDLKRLMLLSLTGVFLFNVCLFLGLRRIGAGTAGVITSFSPIVLASLSCVLLKEHITRTKVLAISIATAGIVLVNMHAAGANSFSWVGFVLIFGVVLCEAAFTLFAKSVSSEVAPMTMSAVVVCVSALLFLPFGVWQLATTDDLAFGLQDWLLLVYLGVVVNAGAYFLWYSGLKVATAIQAAVFTGIIPVSALVLAHLFLNERIAISDGLGVVLVLGGVLLITRSSDPSAADGPPGLRPR